MHVTCHIRLANVCLDFVGLWHVLKTLPSVNHSSTKNVAIVAFVEFILHLLGFLKL